jgi:coniferyl-aldehyde dehydrogenase
MAKPSEFTPNTSQLIKEAVEKYFDKSEFAIFLGGPEVGEEFSKLPFDHLLYTGSGRIAKKVLSQTAENIVPTTMELGGKSPTIISDDADLKLAAKRILFVKTLNNGQICLSPDYIFIKKGLENDFVDALKSVFAEFFPTADGEDTYTSMVNKDHFERMKLYLNDAQAKGASVIELGNFDNQEINLMGTKVILNVNDDMEVMKNEVFGPLLPLMTFEKLDEVTNYINSHDHPLGLYFFGNKKAEQDFVINNTKSGGVTINDVMFHLAQSHLPFGGVGPSGYGHYHGYEGFLNFSNLRAVYYQSKFDKIFEAMRPPRGKSFKAFLDLMKRIS